MQYIWLQYSSTLRQHFFSWVSFNAFPIPSSFSLQFIYFMVPHHWKTYIFLNQLFAGTGSERAGGTFQSGWNFLITRFCERWWWAAADLSHNSNFLFSPDASKMVHFLCTDFLHDLFGSSSWYLWANGVQEHPWPLSVHPVAMRVCSFAPQGVPISPLLALWDLQSLHPLSPFS